MSSNAGVGPRLVAAASWTFAPRRRTRALVVVGLLAAIISAIGLWRELPAAEQWPIQTARLTSLQASVEVVNAGGPPLLVESADSTRADPKYDHVLSGGNYPGLFVFVPLLSWALGISVLSVLKLMLVGLFVIPIALFPLVFHKLTGSVLAAVLTPFLLAYAVGDHAIFQDIYWILGWAVLALLPMVLLAWKLRGRAGLGILLAVMVAASFASSIRGGAGLGILVAGLGVVAFAFTDWSRLRRTGAAAALIVAYLSISPGLMTLADSYAHSYAGDDLVLDKAEGSNPFHIAYIGLGFQPNDDGIYWLDQIGYAAGQREDPGVPYLGPGYDDALRTAFFDRVGDEPLGYVGLELKKADVGLLAAGASTLAFVLVVGIALGVARYERRLLRVALLIAAAPLILGIAPGLVGIPAPNYVYGSTAAFAFLEIVEWALLLALLERHGLPRFEAALRSPGLRSTGDRALIAGAGVLTGLIVAGPVGIRAAVIAAVLVAAAVALLASWLPRRWEIGVASRRPVQIAAAAAIVLAPLVLGGDRAAETINARFSSWQADTAGQQAALGEFAEQAPANSAASPK